MTDTITPFRAQALAAVDAALAPQSSDAAQAEARPAPPQTAAAVLARGVADLDRAVSDVTRQVSGVIERATGARPAPDAYRGTATEAGAINALAAQIGEVRAKLTYLGDIARGLNSIA